MLEEMLEQLKKTEEECRQMVLNAKQRQSKAVETANVEAEALYGRLTEDAHQEGEAILEEARAKMLREEAASKAKSENSRQQLRQAAEPYRQPSIKRVLERLCYDGHCGDA